ncbi:MAG: glycosyltransferase [Acidisphaera sp.]|nr:glycosyltransferase [Acidisphaera sp.]
MNEIRPLAGSPPGPRLPRGDFILMEVEEPNAADAPRGPVLGGRGWVIADEEIAEITVHLDDAFLCYATYGLPRPDIAARFPHYPHADHSGFSFTARFTEEVAEAPRRHLHVTVRTPGGASTRRSVALAPATPDAVSAGQPAPARSAPELWPLRITLETARVDAGGVLRLAGWIAALTPLREVALFLGQEPLEAPELGISRPDVAANYPQYPNAGVSGFRLAQHVGGLEAAQCAVRVKAVCEGGVTRQIIRPLEVPVTSQEVHAGDGSIHVCCDSFSLRPDGAMAVAGWAVSESGITALTVELDGTPVGEAEIGRSRPDVGNRFPRIPSARRAGFRFSRSVERRLEGEHRVLVRVQNGAGEQREVPLSLLVEDRRRAEPSVEDLIRAAAADLRFDIDRPALNGDEAAEPVRGLLTISGWAVAAEGIEAVEVFIDERSAGVAHLGIRREDIAALFPEIPGALLSGFALTVPQRLTGAHAVRVAARGQSGQAAERSFQVVAESAEQSTAHLTIRARVTQAEADLGLALLERLGSRPQFSVLIDPGPADASGRLEETLETLRRQAYGAWRAILPAAPERSTSDDPRIEIRAAAEALPWAAGPGPRFLIRLSAGDRLGADALLELAIESAFNPDADFIYSDERRYDPVLQAMRPFFKPDWSPDLLLSTNYVGRLWCASRDLLAASGLGDGASPAAGEYDAVLRLTDRARAIRHVRKILCERASDAAEPAESERRALAEAFARRGERAEILPGAAAGVYRARRVVGTEALVSIIIPTCASRGLVGDALRSIHERTAYPNVEIVCVDTIPEPDEAGWKPWLRENADQVIELSGPFNWSRFNNAAASAARGAFLLFLNDDVEVLSPDWLHALLEHAERPEVGVVGPLLLYPNGRVQHAGMFLSGSVGRHAFRFAPAEDPGPFGLALAQRNAIAVTGACMMVRRDVFDTLGGFDEAHSVINNDLDFCLRAWRAGRRVVFTPYAALTHHELASRAAISDMHDAQQFSDAWRHLFLKGDPFFSPRLLPGFDDYAPDTEPVEVLHAGHPIVSAERVRSILALKLDHIGDFVLAFPALRRLKQRFPAARLCVLGAKASKTLAALEPCIDEFIEFNFFHVRSALGGLDVGEAELADLRARLAPRRFDIAIDLRVQPETRHVLQYTGAGLLAGFEHGGRFPWLDVVLEWEGDTAFAAKRAHVSDRLLRLAETMAIACEPDRPTLPQAAAQRDPGLLRRLAGRALPRGFLRKQLVCVHPGVGTEMRQWPPASYAALIELLVREEDVHVLLIGVGEEAAIAEEVIAHLPDRSRVVSLVGRVGLAELPQVLRACALYVGNNSGPQHVAAAVGVPTVGVHSGNVDATEWAPVGDRAIAVRRKVLCSPCYIARPEDCHRGLACLHGISPGEVYRACRRMLRLGNDASNGTGAHTGS